MSTACVLVRHTLTAPPLLFIPLHLACILLTALLHREPCRMPSLGQQKLCEGYASCHQLSHNVNGTLTLFFHHFRNNTREASSFSKLHLIYC